MLKLQARGTDGIWCTINTRSINYPQARAELVALRECWLNSGYLFDHRWRIVGV